MDVEQFLEAVAERDIDLLVLEELNVSPEFAEWFYRENRLAIPSGGLIKAVHSLTDPELGESDLVAFFGNGHAILIENKINAIAQPEQAKRYRMRGKLGIEEGIWKTYSTCMIAPLEYLNTSVEASEYGNKISYEQIASWFSSLRTIRGDYRAIILESAIEQSRRGYVMVPNQPVTAFWQNYYNYCRAFFPDLLMNRPKGKPANSTWIYFHPLSLPKGYQLIHKLEKGEVALQITNMPDMAAQVAKAFHDQEFVVAQAQNSVVFKMHVKAIDPLISFENQKVEIHEALMLAMEFASKITGIKENVESVAEKTKTML